ncbi:MAG: transglycosylase SLT domain-containing protein [Flavobacteriales bacterium]|jgi:membrane-bound lytic murein transglycosylase F
MTLRVRSALWLMITLVMIFGALLSCDNGPFHRERKLPSPVKFDLDSIRARGKLILLTENSASTYFLYRGQARGFDYELVKDFARSLGVKLEVRLLDDVDKMFELLNRGEGDLIASNLTITPERSDIVEFSDPLYTSREVLVQRLSPPDSASYPHITDTAQLHLIPIWVHKYSSFYSRLKSMEMQSGMPFHIHEAPGQISTEDLIRLTASGELSATVTDENLAIIQKEDYPELDMSLAISGNEQIAWAVRSNSYQLLETLNTWLKKTAVSRKTASLYGKYFASELRTDFRGPFVLPNLSDNQISVYDSLFKKYSPQIGWDWKLLAALVYQESRFNPNAVSWSGAFGLMQMMPETASRFGCENGQTEEPNIRAGVKYIQYLDRMWKDKVTNPGERLKFVLASYNIGPGHILDARHIAGHMGLIDTIWDGNVAEALLLKSQEKYYTMPGVKHGYCNTREPYHFVRKILAVYEHYKQHIRA